MSNSNNSSSLLDYPSYVINLDRSPDRLESAINKLNKAGFKNVHRWRAVDALHDDLTNAWLQHGSPRKDPSDPDFIIYPGRQGCMLSHLNIWKHIIESDVPIANVFEDDIMFHPEWNTLQQTFYDETPKDFHILYLGSKHYSENTNHIQTSPVYCTHAYTITNNGARVLYNMLVNDPRGVSTIDGHIRKYMNYIQAMLPNEKIRPLMWYAWNATGHPCMEADMPADFKWRNAGLVFQDYVWPSFIQESYT